MTLPDYQIVILDPESGAVVKVFDGNNIDQLTYSRILNGIGICALSIPYYLVSSFAEIPWDSFIEIYRKVPATQELIREETYFLRIKQKFWEGDQEKLALGGVSLNDFLNRRVINPEDDPLEAGGYSTKDGPADTVMRAYIREQAADLASTDRAFAGLTVPADAGIGEPVGARLRYENLLEQMVDLGKRGGIDFQIDRTTGLNFEVFLGVYGDDRTRSTNEYTSPWTAFDPRRGTLVNPSYEIDRKAEKTFAYVMGQGQGEDRIVFPVSGGGILDTPYNRIEFQTDARNVEKGDSLAIVTSAYVQISENAYKETLTFEVDASAQGTIYRVDWSLGDYVTIIWDEIEKDMRIVEIEIALGQEGETITAVAELQQ